MPNIEIHEREEGNRYEAYALVNGVKLSKVVWRSLTGWPHDYKQIAHAEIRAEAARIGTA